MPDVAKKGITVKVAAELHAEVSEYIRSHGMTMSELPEFQRRGKAAWLRGYPRHSLL